MVHRGDETDGGCIKTRAGGDERLALAEVEAAAAHRMAWSGGLVDDDGIAVARRILLDDDGVGAARHRAAGEDADRLAGADRAIESMAGGSHADYPETRRCACDIGGAHRIAIHGACGKRRLVACRFEIAGGDAAKGAIELDDFGTERFDARNNAGLGFVDRQ